jgi:hypothetical protein
MNPLPGHPDSDVRPTLATHHYPDLKTMDTMTSDRVINAFNKPPPTARQQEQQQPNEVRFIKTPRKTAKSNNLARYGSWGYMMLGMLTVSVVLLMCGIWECIRRVQKSDVMEHFNANGEPIETMASQEHDDDNNCPQYDPPPPYSSLFPLAKDFNSTTASGDSSAPPSIYFTASSATFLPTAPSPPASLQDMQLPQQQQQGQRIDVDTSASPA